MQTPANGEADRSQERELHALAELAAVAEALYFEKILPRFIQRHFRGAGYVFLLEMLRAHDEDRLLEVLQDPEPPARAQKMAAKVRAGCPVVLDDSLPVQGFALVLGRFTHSFSAVGLSESSHRQVILYPVALLTLGLPPELLAAEVLKTIFHEYIHYFESFLLLSEQPLRVREQGAAGEGARGGEVQEFGVRRYSLRQARRLDTRRQVWRWLGRGLLGAVVLLALAAGLGAAGWSPGCDEPARAPRPRASAQTRAYIASDQVRRVLVEERDPDLLVLRAGAAPCPVRVKAPEQLGDRQLGGAGSALGREGRDSLFRMVLGLRLLDTLAGYDLLPALAAGVGPIDARLAAGDGSLDARTEPFTSPHRMTFVVTRWHDALVAPPPPSDAGAVRVNTPFFTGMVSGRLLVWSMAETEFICVSREVTARTPPLTLVKVKGGGGHPLGDDDPLLKARLETLIAAIRAATGALRRPAPRPAPGDAG